MAKKEAPASARLTPGTEAAPAPTLSLEAPLATPQYQFFVFTLAACNALGRIEALYTTALLDRRFYFEEASVNFDREV